MVILNRWNVFFSVKEGIKPVNLISNIADTPSFVHQATMEALARLSLTAADEFRAYNIRVHTVILDRDKGPEEIIQEILFD